MHLDIVDPQPDAVMADTLGLRPRVYLAAGGAVYLLHHSPTVLPLASGPMSPFSPGLWAWTSLALGRGAPANTRRGGAGEPGALGLSPIPSTECSPDPAHV